MRKSAALLLVLVLTASSIITFLPVKAEARTIVVPDDYPTITAAIKNANDGDTIFVKKGTYEEKTLEIKKALSLIGEDAEFTEINLDPPLYETTPNIIGQYWSWFGPSITVGANDFEISGLTVNTPGVINIPGGAIDIVGNRTQILGNRISTHLSVKGSFSNIAENTLNGLSINGTYSRIEENTFLKSVSAFGSYGNISANNIVGPYRPDGYESFGMWVCGSYFNISTNNIVGRDNSGIHVEGSFCIVYGNNVTDGMGISSIDVSGNGTIVARNFVDRSDVGIRIDGSDNIIYANRITNCASGSLFPSYDPTSGVGLAASGSNTFYANYVANNEWGANINQFPETNLTSTLYHNNFIDNTHQVATDDFYNAYGTDNFDNSVEGNFWSDYSGTDSNGDGMGDTPYVIDANRSDRYPLMAPFDIDSVAVDLSDWMSPPSVHLISPINTTYASADVALEFTVNKQTSWIGYSLDGGANVTITGNTTLLRLSYGSHNVIVHATDMVGHNGVSETIVFNVTEAFPIALVAIAIAIAVTSGVAFLVYFKRNNKQPKSPSNNEGS